MPERVAMMVFRAPYAKRRRLLHRPRGSTKLWHRAPTPPFARCHVARSNAGICSRCRRFCERHPPRPEYLLTDKGKALGPALAALRDRGLQHAEGRTHPKYRALEIAARPRGRS